MEHKGMLHQTKKQAPLQSNTALSKIPGRELESGTGLWDGRAPEEATCCGIDKAPLGAQMASYP